MEPAEQIATVKQLAADVNSGRLDAIRDGIAVEFFNHIPEDEPGANEVFYQIASDIRAAFPDLHIEVEEFAADGERLKGRLTISGTQTAPFWNVPPGGNPFRWSAPVSFRFVGHRVAVNWDGITPREMVGIARELRLVNPPEDMDKPSRFPNTMPEILLRILYTGQVGDKPCDHLHLIQVTEPTTNVCADCVALGDTWPALRMCLICGYVGCCDAAKNHHMKQHYEQTGHGLFRSIRKGDGWIWCYPDNAFRGKRTLEKHQHRDV